MVEKYQNPNLVKLAAEIKAAHYEEISNILFGLADQLQQGKIEILNSLTTRVNKSGPPPSFSLEHLQDVAVIAQNSQDRMLIGAHLQTVAGKHGDIKEAYQKMQKTGQYFPTLEDGRKLDLEPEYTALELAANQRMG